MNIISNAVKYNKEKGEILLSYYETQVDDRHILFEFHCKDTGVGMSKEDVYKRQGYTGFASVLPVSRK